ncbi:acyl-CoA dehydrogenase family protein [Actinomadura verrucosospora]|uniref:Acyl-CoA dehydrogenase n=1 Tax=Actinomadura verrucosospora TaxID=46165 RepID=A0A7D3VUD1_ACTVE|nr:acyl-CoA dehydrogenase family protein [Actinomadura verrucosospora]QKG19956.1 acyl-CoA dehydrogenase [Actinomadura verrucosospora]
MDFDLDGDLEAARELASEIFADLATLDRVVEAEKDQGGFDRTLWKALADAGLLGIALPEQAGGAGLGMLGLVTVLEQQGRRVAPVPLWPVAVAALTIARFGTADQVSAWLPGILDGSAPVTFALEESTGDAGLAATRTPAGLSLTGDLLSVPAAREAAAVLVPARLDGTTVMAIVPTGGAGLATTELAATSRESRASVRCAGVTVAGANVLPSDGEEVLSWSRRRARVALAALQTGVCEQALQVTARYTSQREQFGRPLSTNQAVAVRAADAYLDTEAIRLTTRRAAWLMDSGQEDAAEAAALVAKWWASRAGLRAVHATQHLHGGIGADVDYPVHRYFLWGRQIAFSLGAADATAAALGDRLDQAPPIGAPS